MGMPDFLRRQKNHNKRFIAARRGRKPHLEVLEDRQVLSASSILTTVELSPVNMQPFAVTQAMGPQAELEVETKATAVDAGDYYWSGDQKIPLWRVADEWVVTFDKGVDAKSLLESMAPAGKTWTGKEIRQQLGGNRYVLSGSALADRASFESMSQTSGVLSATPLLRFGQDGAWFALKNEVIVSLRPGVVASEFFDSTEFSEFRPLRGTTDQFVGTLKDPSGLDVLEIASVLHLDPRVAWASPNGTVDFQQALTPNDPGYGSQWHLNNTSQFGAKSDADSDVAEAWNTATGDGSLVIAVIDDGVQINHPDLVIFTNTGEIPGNGIDDDMNGYEDDVHGWDFFDDDANANPSNAGDKHGTAVAGLAAANSNNNTGVSGTAFDAKILPIKIAEWVGSSTVFVDNDTIAEAIYYAAGRTKDGSGTWQAADIINASWAFLSSASIPVIDDAILWATTNGRDGVGATFFAAAGNSASGYRTIPVEFSGIPAGTIQFEWRYTKNGSNSAGEDSVWLSNFQLSTGTVQRFDASVLPTGWSTSGNANWTVAGDPSHTYGTGRYALKAGTIGNNQSSNVRSPNFFVPSTTAMQFSYWVSSETNADKLSLWYSVDSGVSFAEVDFSNSPGVVLSGVPTVTSNVSFPASSTRAIAVGASTDWDYRSHYSQYGSKLDFVAPSSGGFASVLTTDLTGADGYNSVSDYAGFTGTSASTPISAGIAALLLTRNPQLTPANIRSLMRATADKIGGGVGAASYVNGFNQYYGYGRVNAANAVNGALTIFGDYNQDGSVNLPDYTIWRDNVGATVTPYSGGDGNGDGIINVADYAIFKKFFGETIGSVDPPLLDYLAGDYNADGAVDDVDHGIWAASFGSSTNLAADGNGNGVVDLADLEVWETMVVGEPTLGALVGDFNDDKIIDFKDYDLWLLGDPSADADEDTDVDEDDYALWLANYGKYGVEQLPSVTRAVNGAPFKVALTPPSVVDVTLSLGGNNPFELSDVDGSGEQLRTVPVGGIDTIAITFSEEVFVLKNALTLSSIQGVTIPAISSFGYNVPTRTATWTFASALEAGQYTIGLADTIVDLDHEKLDGEFYSPWALSETSGASSTLGSGDSQAGGNFEFRFTNLPGDFNHDNVVDSLDVGILSANNGNVPTGATHAQGDANGDGAVSSADVSILSNNYGRNYTNWVVPNVFLVSTLTDEDDANYSLGDLSLREAIDLADSNAGVDTIVFHYSLLGQTIALTLGEINIDTDVILRGPGADKLTLSGSDASRVFFIEPDNTVSMSGLTIADGLVTGTSDGGGIYNRSDLTLEDMIFEDNASSDRGGAIHTAKGHLIVRNSTFRNNTAKAGGGIGVHLHDGAAFTMTGSTVVDNTANVSGAGSGGGVFLWGSSTNPGPAKISNSTFGGNYAAEYGGGIRGFDAGLIELVNVTVTDNGAGNSGGGVSFSGGANMLTHNSIISGNTATVSNKADGDAAFHASSSFNLLGIINNGTSGLTHGVAGNMLGVTDPGLTALTDNGGRTLTYALLEGSLAIDAGSDDIAFDNDLLFDQRGRWRTMDGDEDDIDTVDIGAFELAADEYFGSMGP